MEKLKIKDTGLAEIGGEVVYSVVNSGEYYELNSASIRGEGETITTNYNTKIEESGLIRPPSNSHEAATPSRFTIVCEITSSSELNNILSMFYTKGYKQLRGGNFLIQSMPYQNSDSSIYIVLKNWRYNETVAQSVNTGVLTITCEQVVD